MEEEEEKEEEEEEEKEEQATADLLALVCVSVGWKGQKST